MPIEMNNNPEWLKKMADLEDGCCITAGDLKPIDFGITDEELDNLVYQHLVCKMKHHFDATTVKFEAFEEKNAGYYFHENLRNAFRAAMLVAYHKGKADTYSFIKTAKEILDEASPKGKDSGNQGLAPKQG